MRRNGRTIQIDGQEILSDQIILHSSKWWNRGKCDWNQSRIVRVEKYFMSFMWL